MQNLVNQYKDVNKNNGKSDCNVNVVHGDVRLQAFLLTFTLDKKGLKHQKQ